MHELLNQANELCQQASLFPFQVGCIWSKTSRAVSKTIVLQSEPLCQVLEVDLSPRG